MRELEYFSGLKLLPGTWTILRLDGRAFTRFTEGRFEKPFDERFRNLMLAAAWALMEDLQGLYACTHSDEISVLLPPEWDQFSRRVEKIVSVSAGLASAAFTAACGEAAHFDSRVWQGVDVADVTDYFQWRAQDAARCALHGWCYWTLRHAGQDAEAASWALEGRGRGEQNELLFRHGLNFNDLPAWQRRGCGLYWESYTVPGFDPVRARPVEAQRRRLTADLDLPLGEGYTALLQRLIREQGL